MCGRFTLKTDADDIRKRFHLEKVPSLKARYNIAPSQEIAVIRNEAKELELLTWGLIPRWAKDSKMAFINARSETASEKPAFRSAFKKHRCLILTDGFYEWKKEGDKKIPYFIYLKSDEPFAFAGLWEHWTTAEGEVLETACILTTDANSFMKKLHHRMPVILPEKSFKNWLDPENQDKEKISALLKPFDPKLMEAYAVSPFVNKPTNSGPKCIERDD